MNKILEYSKTVVIVILFVFIIGLFIRNNRKIKVYDNLINKYQKQINKIISKNELKDNKIVNLKLDMTNRELIIASLKIQLKNNKIDTIYSLNKYKLSPYAKVGYTIKYIEKDTISSIIEILPHIYIKDYGFIFKPNVSALYNSNIIGNISITFFHYKRVGIDFGIGYGLNKHAYFNIGLNYIFWSNSLIKSGYMLDMDLNKYIYIGLGVNL